jgi:ATP-dependent RNA helicase DeaD
MNSFEQLGITQNLLKGIEKLGFTTPTSIQQQAIPILLENKRDFVGLAQTGTGKTAAFGLPLLELINYNQNYPQALILAPTRELCVQISQDFKDYSLFSQHVKVLAVYGGASISTQISALKRGVHIVAATPGRLLDLIDRRAIDLSKITHVVLDEADEMLNMGFQEDINSILSNTPSEKRSWLFSATMPSEVRAIANRYMNNPYELTIGKKNAANENISHEYFIIRDRDKYSALKRIVDFYPEIFGLIFCRTKIETQEIAEKLMKDGYDADSLHGDLSQQQRDKVMARFKNKTLQMLVATDVAARGIDVDDVTHVINYHLPDELESYTHRSGRTARAGKTGVSISILTGRDTSKIKHLERITHTKFQKKLIPTGAEICEKQMYAFINKVNDVQVNEKEIAKYLPLVNKALEDLSRDEIIKKFTSLEFNQFIEYYKNATDINASFRDDNFSNENSKGNFGNGENRLFINLGHKDNVDKKEFIDFISALADVKPSCIENIQMNDAFSHFNVTTEADATTILEAVNGAKHNGRRLRVDKADRKKEFNNRGGFHSGNGYKKSNRPRITEKRNHYQGFEKNTSKSTKKTNFAHHKNHLPAR